LFFGRDAQVQGDGHDTTFLTWAEPESKALGAAEWTKQKNRQLFA
jgi:hypothetical protein